MSFNGTGVYELVAGIPVVINSTISSTVYNNSFTDVETAMNLLWLHNGAANATASIQMSSNRVILDADEDTSMRASSGGVVTIEAGGVDVAEMDGTAFRTTNALYGLGTPSELTIATGDVEAVRSYHTIDTQSDGASDDLSTISLTSMGGNTIPGFLVLGPENGARTVVVKNGTLIIGSDFSMSDANDRQVLLSVGGIWYEIARSSNG